MTSHVPSLINSVDKKWLVVPTCRRELVSMHVQRSATCSTRSTWWCILCVFNYGMDFEYVSVYPVRLWDVIRESILNFPRGGRSVCLYCWMLLLCSKGQQAGILLRTKTPCRCLTKHRCHTDIRLCMKQSKCLFHMDMQRLAGFSDWALGIGLVL